MANSPSETPSRSMEMRCGNKWFFSLKVWRAIYRPTDQACFVANNGEFPLRNSITKHGNALWQQVVFLLESLEGDLQTNRPSLLCREQWRTPPPKLHHEAWKCVVATSGFSP